ncbi:MAG: cupin domain-containing protein [Nitrososphaeria archaeon]
MTFYRIEEIDEVTVKPGIRRKIIVGDNIMLVVYNIDPGQGLPLHDHPHEQMVYVIEGELEFQIGDRKSVLGAGGIAHVPSNVRHAGKVVSDKPVTEIDVFYPIREDFLKRSHR